MDFGIVHAKIDEIGYITHAENLGYSHCWVTDSQMIRSNCWAVLALAAWATSMLIARIDREHNAVATGGRQTLVRPYPISIEWPTQWAERSPPAEECRREIDQPEREDRN